MTYRPHRSPLRASRPARRLPHDWRAEEARVQRRRPIRLAPVPDQPSWLEDLVSLLLALVCAIVVAGVVAWAMVAVMSWLSPATT